jgi:transposase
MDLRERIVVAVDAGMTHPQTAARFKVSVSTVERYLVRRRATGSLAPTEQRHGPEPKTKQQLHAWLPARLDEVDDATLAEHVAAFVAAAGEPVSLASMSRAIASLPSTTPGQQRTPTGRARRPGRPLKQRP